MTKIAILSVQGDFLEHANIITAHFGGGLEIIYLRSKLDFVPEIDGIIIPGGESTAIRYLAIKHGLWDILLKWIKDGNPIWGTCAGLILLASGIEGSCNEHTLQGLSIVVSRNAYGSQVNSFVSAINSDHIKDSKGIFIRAPIIKDILSSDVEILDKDIFSEPHSIRS
ncbi:hypothetical protein MDAP_002260 [Mitosporidium daphniae]